MPRPKGKKNNPKRERLPFKQSDIERAVRAAQNMDLQISSVEIDPRTGKFKISTAAADASVVADDAKSNSWDEKILTKKGRQTNAED
jgi:hypothetical protein